MSTNDTQICPFCAEEIRAAAIKCRYCGSSLGRRTGVAGEWHRERDGQWLTGVCAGLARQFDFSVTAIRLGFVIATLIGGWGLLIYLALFFLMPTRPAGDAGRQPGDSMVTSEPRGASGDEPGDMPEIDDEQATPPRKTPARRSARATPGTAARRAPRSGRT